MYHCSKCDKKYKSAKWLIKHNNQDHSRYVKRKRIEKLIDMYKKTDELLNECTDNLQKNMHDECSKINRRLFNLRRERLNVYENQFDCPICNKQYYLSCGMICHMALKHKIRNVKKNTKCNYCFKKYSSIGNLNRHLKKCKQKIINIDEDRSSNDDIYLNTMDIFYKQMIDIERKMVPSKFYKINQQHD